MLPQSLFRMSVPNYVLPIQHRRSLSQMLTNEGDRVGELSFQQPVMLVFLRHFGCTFCREALADLSKERSYLEGNMGMKLVLIHMADNALAERYFQRYDLNGVAHISDPDCLFYTAFGLTKGNFQQLFGLRSWVRGFEAGILEGHGVGNRPLGDGFQMPGIFVLREGEVREAFIHKLASDRPNYVQLAECCRLPV